MVYGEVPGGDELAHTVPQAVFTLCQDDFAKASRAEKTHGKVLSTTLMKDFLRYIGASKTEAAKGPRRQRHSHVKIVLGRTL